MGLPSFIHRLQCTALDLMWYPFSGALVLVQSGPPIKPPKSSLRSYFQVSLYFCDVCCSYVSLFPLLMRLLPAASPELGQVLAQLQDPEELWTPYGLRHTRAYHHGSSTNVQQIRPLSVALPSYLSSFAPGNGSAHAT